jgi:hypothetical protein
MCNFFFHQDFGESIARMFFLFINNNNNNNNNNIQPMNIITYPHRNKIETTVNISEI